MDLILAAEERHSVRRYTDKPVPEDIVSKLRSVVEECNAESGLNIQIVCDEPRAFDCLSARYGKFEGVRNYIALVGKKDDCLQERAGYYGERIVLTAQTLGLNTCWVAGTYSRRKCAAEIGKGEKLICVIAFGYGKTQGVPHKSKQIERLYSCDGEMPDWFRKGMECATLAPTAVNQQQFRFTYSQGKVKAESLGGFYSKLDLGIARFHFELGAGKENFEWQNK